MGFWGDERGQAIQVGAVLLFGILIVGFATYQAFVVPQENRQIEFNHNQQVQGQLQELRGAFLSADADGDVTVPVQLGVRYPGRAVAVNPGPAVGALRTTGTRDAAVELAVTNATAAGEVGDFWTGDAHTYNTGGLVYQPEYNEYTQAPTTVYENTVLYNQFRSQNVTVAGQRLVDGRQLRLVTLNGSLSTSQSGTASVDVRAVSASTRTVAVTNRTDTNVTLTLPTRLGEGRWEELLEEEFITNGGYVADVTTDPVPGRAFDRLNVSLRRNVTYSLSLTRIGVGTRVRSPNPAYLTPVSGNASAVPESDTQRVVVEVRDALNNPVSGVRVNATTRLAASAVQPDTGVTDADGRLALTYDAPDDIDGGPAEDRLNVSFTRTPGTGFDADTPENASAHLTVRNADGSGTGGGGAGGGRYAVDWVTPSTSGDNPAASLSSCDSEDCTWDVGASADNRLVLRGTTSPTVNGITLDFGVNDSSVALLSGVSEATTGSAGEATTEIQAQSDGTLSVFVASGGSSEDINVTVQNSGGGTGPSGPPGFSGSVAATNLAKGSTSATQRFTFTLNQTLQESEYVTIDLADPQNVKQNGNPDPVDYRNAFVDSTASTTPNSSPSIYNTNSTGAELRLTADSDVAAGTNIEIVVDGIDTQNGNGGPFTVVFTRSDGTTETDTFNVN